jgi:hypothetical protein
MRDDAIQFGATPPPAPESVHRSTDPNEKPGRN